MGVESVKRRLVEEGGVPDADDEAINTPEKVWDFAAKIDEARKKAKAFLARCEEATNNADGGGRRRLSELEITHDKVEACFKKEGLTMAGSECDVDSVKTKRYCATKTAASVHDALENGLGLEKEKGKTLVEALETMRKKLKKDRDLDSADVDTESTEEEAALEKEADDKLDLTSTDSDKDRLDFIKRYAAFKKKRKETKVTEKISCEIGSGSTMEVEEGASVEIEKGGDLAVKGKLIAPKGSTIVCTRGATLDLTSTDSEGAETEDVDTVPKIGGKIEAKGKGSKIKVDEIDLEADGSLTTKKKGKIVFARSNRVKHRREGTTKHTIKLGSKFAGLSSDDVKVTKELKKQKREEDEVIEELEATEVTTTDSTKKDLTKSNLIARMKERGCLKSDGTEDATVDTITKAKSKFAKYVRAKKKCLFM